MSDFTMLKDLRTCTNFGQFINKIAYCEDIQTCSYSNKKLYIYMYIYIYKDPIKKNLLQVILYCHQGNRIGAG